MILEQEKQYDVAHLEHTTPLECSILQAGYIKIAKRYLIKDRSAGTYLTNEIARAECEIAASRTGLYD